MEHIYQIAHIGLEKWNTEPIKVIIGVEIWFLVCLLIAWGIASWRLHLKRTRETSLGIICVNKSINKYCSFYATTNLCENCGRILDVIVDWIRMTDDEKLEVRGRLSRNQFISSINKLSLICL